MILSDLTERELLRRFRHPGLSWEVGPVVVRVRTNRAQIARQIAFLYARFPVRDPGTIADVGLSARSRLPRSPWIRLFVDGEVCHRWVRSRVAVPLIEWTLNATVFQRQHQYLMLHSAVVARDEHVAILSGAAGSGKSTLCAALVHRGWRLLSDEVALVRLSDGLVLPVPRPVSLKEESIGVIRDFAPQAVLGPEWPGTERGTLAHVLPPEESVLRSAEPAAPAWLLFPSYQRGAGATLRPLSKAQALLRAAKDSFNYSVLGRPAFETLSRVVDRCRCYEFPYGDLEQAVNRLDGLPEPPAISF